MSEDFEKSRDSLERVQHFETSTLPRLNDLGAHLSFARAVEPADRIVKLFRQIPIEHLGDFPDSHLMTIRNQADSFFNILNDILNFSPEISEPVNTRQSLIETLERQYDGYFTALAPLISYAASRLRDFSALERDARGAMQRVQDEAGELTDLLKARQQEAERILSEVRQVAAEQGVSQQAVYFKEEYDNHLKQANSWKRYTIMTAVGLGTFAALSVFLPKIPFLAPTSNYEAVQLGLSKFLVFAVIAYMLFLCARNFLSHLHNAVVNKHRQNALLTFNSLADAAASDDRRDVVLTYAAACIFSPQETGYVRPSGGNEVASTKLIEILPKLSSSSGT